MRKQDHLVGLIKSLSANEKRNFRLHANHHQEDTGYLKLFDALEGKENYNAAALSKELDIPLTKLQSSKNYLAKVLLKSLRFYNDSSSHEAYLANTIAEIEDLIGRRLYDYASELLDKALTYAEQKNCPGAIISIVRLKLSIALTTGNFEEVLSLDVRMQKALTILREEYDIHNMTALIAQFNRRRRPEEDFLYHDHVLLKIKPEDLHSKQAKLAWFTMMSNYLIAIDQMPAVLLKHVRKVIAIFEADISLQEAAALQFVHSYAWLFTMEANADNYDIAWEEGEKLLALIAKNKKLLKPGEVNHYLEFAGTIRSTVSFYQGHYPKALALSQYIYARKNELNASMRIQVYFNLARTLLHMHKTADALSAIDELIELGPELRADLQVYIRPMMILAQLDLGNYELISYLVRSTRSWMKRQKLSNESADVFLSHAYAIGKAPISKRKTEWNKLKAAMANPLMRFLERELHLTRWIEEFVR